MIRRHHFALHQFSRHVVERISSAGENLVDRLGSFVDETSNLQIDFANCVLAVSGVRKTLRGKPCSSQIFFSLSDGGHLRRNREMEKAEFQAGIYECSREFSTALENEISPSRLSNTLFFLAA